MAWAAWAWVLSASSSRGGDQREAAKMASHSPSRTATCERGQRDADWGARAAVAQAARAAIDQGTLREVGKDQAVVIPADALHEPSFHTIFTGGQRNVVLSGNREFSAGDRLARGADRREHRGIERIIRLLHRLRMNG